MITQCISGLLTGNKVTTGNEAIRNPKTEARVSVQSLMFMIQNLEEKLTTMTAKMVGTYLLLKVNILLLSIPPGCPVSKQDKNICKDRVWSNSPVYFLWMVAGGVIWNDNEQLKNGLFFLYYPLRYELSKLTETGCLPFISRNGLVPVVLKWNSQVYAQRHLQMSPAKNNTFSPKTSTVPPPPPPSIPGIYQYPLFSGCS